MTAPTLIAWGDCDTYATRADQDALAQHSRRATTDLSRCRAHVSLGRPGSLRQRPGRIRERTSIKGEHVMNLSSKSSLLTHLFRRVVVVGAAAAMLVLPAAAAQGQPRDGTDKKRDRIIEPTVDVAEDLNGKFVPTLVKPEDTQPERGSFFSHRRTGVPSRHDSGRWRRLQPISSRTLAFGTAGAHIWSQRPRFRRRRCGSTLHSCSFSAAKARNKSRLKASKAPARSHASSRWCWQLRWLRGRAATDVSWVNSTGGVNLRVTFILRKVTH